MSESEVSLTLLARRWHGDIGLILLVELGQNVSGIFRIEPRQNFGLILDIKLVENFNAIFGALHLIEQLNCALHVITVERFTYAIDGLLKLHFVEFGHGSPDDAVFFA